MTIKLSLDQADKVVFFDGVCNMCNASVDFVMQRTKDESIKFSSLQGELAAKVLPEFGLNTSQLSSILFFESGRMFRESSAALKICKYLKLPWSLMVIFLVVPRFLRDGVYRYIAQNRYKWFGQADTCRLPTPQEAARFYD